MPPRPLRRGANRAALGRDAAVVVAYVVLNIGFTWPLAALLGDRFVLERGADLWQHVWNFGWVRTALADLHQSPYHTYSIFYPTGVPLVYHALNLFSAIVSLPLQPTLGLIPAFNLLLLGNLVAAALAAYCLARVLGLDRGPAFLAGLLYACSPLLSSSFNHGQGELVSVFWIPLFAGLLIRGGGLRGLGLPPGPRGYLVAAGAALVGSVLAIYYWTVTLAIFLGLYLLVESIAWARAGGGAALRRWWARLLWLVGAAGVLALPLGVLLLRAQLRSPVELGIAGGTSDAAGTYTLSAAVFAIADTRTLVASLDGQEVGRYSVTRPPGGVVTIPLTPGAHTLTLASVEPAVTPPKDPRSLSLGYRSLTLARQP